MTFASMMCAAAETGTVEIAPGWGQGRSTFGGLTMALATARIRAQLGSSPNGPVPLRSISASFAGPVAAGPAEVSAEVIRAGRSATYISGAVTQGGTTRATVQAAFASARASKLSRPGGVRAVGQVAAGTPFGFIPGLTPDFLQHYDLVWTSGAAPFSRSAEPDFSGWMRYRDTDTAFTLEHFVAMVDCWPPSVLPMLSGPTPLSTMTWTVTMITDELPTDAAQWWHYRVTTDAVEHGYASSRAEIRFPTGELAAVSQQSVAVFD